jgi:hypothetical protein
MKTNWAEHFQNVSRGGSPASFGIMEPFPVATDFRPSPFSEPDPRVYLLEPAAVWPSRPTYDVFGLDLEGDVNIFGHSMPKKGLAVLGGLLALVLVGSSLSSPPALAAAA